MNQRQPRPNAIFVPRTLGEALAVLQRRSNLRRDELARLADLAQGTVSNYLRDLAVPGAGSLRRISSLLADRLGEDPEALWIELGQLLDLQLAAPTQEGADVTPLLKAAATLDEPRSPDDPAST